jgi:hypothetical protein
LRILLHKGDSAKNWAEVGAFLCAGLFFVVRLLFGTFIFDARLTLCCRRQPSPSEPGYDAVSIVATLRRDKEGGHVAIHLEDAQALFAAYSTPFLQETQLVATTSAPSTAERACVVPFEGVERRPATTDGAAASTRISFAGVSADKQLNFAPGDEMHFVAACLVPSKQTILIEVVFLYSRRYAQEWLGKLKRHLVGTTMFQSKCSEISFPY